MRAGQGIDQLPGDAHASSRLAYRALEDIAHAELAPDMLHVDGAPLVGEGRIAGDDEEPADLAQSSDEGRGQRALAFLTDADLPAAHLSRRYTHAGRAALTSSP